MMKSFVFSLAVACLTVGAIAQAPTDVKLIELNMDGRILELESMNGTFIFDSSVVSFERYDGSVVTSAAADALIGTSVTFSGTYTGSDAFGLSDIVLDGVLSFSQVAGADINLTVIQNPGTVTSVLAGPNGNYPRPYRNYASVNPPVIALQSGLASTSLLSFINRATTVGASAQVQLRNGVPGIRHIQAEAAFPATRPYESIIHTNGNGDVYIGTINADQTELYHLFTYFVSNPTGSGPHLGIQADDLTITIMSLPVGFSPFHVLPDAYGNFAWSLPANTVPIGISVDYVGIHLTPGVQITGGSPQNILF